MRCWPACQLCGISGHEPISYGIFLSIAKSSGGIYGYPDYMCPGSDGYLPQDAKRKCHRKAAELGIACGHP